MKRLLKALWMITLLAALLGLFAVWGSAESVSRNGLEAELTVDQPNYAPGEEITALLTVKNTNGFAVENVQLELLLPEGVRLIGASETTWVLAVLDAGATETVSVKLAVGEASSEAEATTGTDAAADESKADEDDEKAEQDDGGRMIVVIAAAAAVVILAIVVVVIR